MASCGVYRKTGGMSEVIPLPEGGFCSYSPDGKKAGLQPGYARIP